MILTAFNIKQCVEEMVGGFDYSSIYFIDLAIDGLVFGVGKNFDVGSLCDELQLRFPHADFIFETTDNLLIVDW